jgi:uncharacterized membrane protein
MFLANRLLHLTRIASLSVSILSLLFLLLNVLGQTFLYELIPIVVILYLFHCVLIILVEKLDLAVDSRLCRLYRLLDLSKLNRLSRLGRFLNSR